MDSARSRNLLPLGVNNRFLILGVVGTHLSSIVMPEYLGLEQRSQIVGMWNAGLSIQQISQQVAIPKSTVYDTIRRFWERGTCANHPKSGRLKILNNEDCQDLDRVYQRKQMSEPT
ncbi:hypothetical protein O181_011422 [Austropuccinia psidii MF-1]|uniref:Paired domain-containing protein n=1 Tax=Austropuccinia psidii MF-1 TaxID=1389203 RepID=A0A9Q3BVP6_9BASI|nr:hypothetical protein [Austropuccinia psidii MF-1]